MSNISLLNDGDTGLQARTIINALVTEVNAGTAGTSGTSGKSFNFTGGWLNTDPYGLNDVVQYGTPYNLYVANDNVAIGEDNPAINAKWTLLVQSGTSGTSGSGSGGGDTFPYTGDAVINGTLRIFKPGDTSGTSGGFVVGTSGSVYNRGPLNTSTNTFFGEDVGLIDTGGGNTAFGYRALRANTSGSGNIAIGFEPLSSNLNGGANIAVGTNSLYSNTSGGNNISLGQNSLYSNTDGNNNIAIGQQALASNTNGFGNIAIGVQALASSESALANIAIGEVSLYVNTTGDSNTAIGNQTLSSNITGYNNIAIGPGSLLNNTSGNNNISIGAYSNSNSASGEGNTNMGSGSLGIQNGSNNTAIGSNTASFWVSTSGFQQITNMDNSILIGAEAMPLGDNEVYEIVIGGPIGNGSNTTTLGYSQTESLYLGGNPGEGIVLTSPDGTKYKITVANNGTLTTTAI